MPKGQPALRWTAENEAKLLQAIIALYPPVSIDYAAIATVFGDNVPASAIQTKIGSVRKIAAALNLAANTGTPKKKRSFRKLGGWDNNDESITNASVDDEATTPRPKRKRSEVHYEDDKASEVLFTSDGDGSFTVNKETTDAKDSEPSDEEYTEDTRGRTKTRGEWARKVSGKKKPVVKAEEEDIVI